MNELLSTYAQCISCSECGIIFSVPAAWSQQKRSSGEVFFCPNGHRQCFYTAEMKAREEQKNLEAEQRRHERAVKAAEKKARKAAELAMRESAVADLAKAVGWNGPSQK